MLRNDLTILLPASSNLGSARSRYLPCPFFSRARGRQLHTRAFTGWPRALLLKINKKIKDGTSPHWSRDSVGSKRYSINDVNVGSVDQKNT